ncbi:MAG: PIN domain-containing protein [Planctomycetaceae bacterium]|jgi:predicted nucleic acid-binding protein|nr:PIN domain-containing protein [Planctomycetaceae bacterium]
MNEKIFIDSDIVLDVLMEREDFYEYSAKIFDLGISKVITLFTTPVVLANVFYLIRKKYGVEKSKELLQILRLFINVLPVEEKTVDMALNSNFRDFEDGLQYFASKENNITILITRNKKDYNERGIMIQSAEEYVKSKYKIL